MAAEISQAAKESLEEHDAPAPSKSALLAVVDRALIKYLKERFHKASTTPCADIDRINDTINTGNAGEE